MIRYLHARENIQSGWNTSKINNMGSLSDRLKKLGVEVGAQNLTPGKKKQSQHTIQSVIPGEELLNRYGSVYVAVENNPVQEKYGNTPVSYPDLPRVLAHYCDAATLTERSAQDFVFIDTETTGLGLGTGTFAFLIGIGTFRESDFLIQQFFLRDPSEETAALVALSELMPENPVIVSFNGKAFDIPLLNNRYILNSLTTPFEQVIHLDLLHLARRLWRERLPSRTLINLEGQILSAQRTQEDVPGWVIPQLYNDYLNTGDARLVKNVFYHNAKDILAMAALLNYVSDVLSQPVDQLDIPVVDIISIGILHQSLGNTDQASDIFRYALSHELPDELHRSTLQRHALLLKSLGAWDEAIQHWTQAASLGQVDACIELAKYYEHKDKNYQEALSWTRTALDQLATPADTFEWLEALNHRLDRLIRRINNSINE